MQCVVIVPITARWRGSSGSLNNDFAGQSQQVFLLQVTVQLFLLWSINNIYKIFKN
jgi:hypothetical protein